MAHLDTVLEDRITDADIQSAQQQYIENAGTFETVDTSQCSAYILELLADSFVSPVQRIHTAEATYYGVADYQDGDEWYGYVAYDERSDGAKRVVGVREVSDAQDESELPHVTAGDPSGSFADQPSAGYADLAARLQEHYDTVYGRNREQPEPEHTGPPITRTVPTYVPPDGQ